MKGLTALLLPLLILPWFAASPVRCETANVTDYRPVLKECRDASGRSSAVIREFIQAGVPRVLVVDPATLSSRVLDSGRLSCSSPAPSAPFSNSPYISAVRKYTSLPHHLQNDGATRSSRASDAYFLTVDLCPSRHMEVEPDLMRALESMSIGKRPVPVAMAITGTWAATHRDALSMLMEKARQGMLEITWVNHSHSHLYDAGQPFSKTFMLTPGLDQREEILAVERMLLEKGLVPSPFFRFPGLVSSGALMGLLRELSLIPLGSDAWLAKGEKPMPGSFVLVHGNGNEPKGIRMLVDWLRASPQVRFAPLREAFQP